MEASANTNTNNNNNAIDILLSDHKKLIKIMDQIEKIADTGDANIDALFQDFKNNFNLHDKAEDDIFYPALESIEKIHKLILKGYQAHHIVEVGILELRLMPYKSENWAPKFSVIKDSILTHMAEEENVLFPQVTSFLKNDELAALGNKILEQRAS